MMQNKALVVIDLQNDITKNYREIIDAVNATIEWAEKQQLYVIYIRNENITADTRTFKPGTKGAELVPELRVVSDHVFVKTKSNALTSEDFAAFIAQKEIAEFPDFGFHGIKSRKFTSLLSAMSGHDFVPSVLLRAKCDGRDNPTLFNALYKLVHILINFHLKRMVGKIINFRNGYSLRPLLQTLSAEVLP